MANTWTPQSMTTASWYRLDQHLEGGCKPGVKAVQGGKHVGEGEVQQGPQLSQTVVQGSAGQQQPPANVKRVMT